MGVSLKNIASHGRNGDTEAIHVNKREIPLVDAFLRALGGSGTRNPEDGNLEYFGNEGGGRGYTGGGGFGKDGRTAGAGRADRDQQNASTPDAAQRSMTVSDKTSNPGGGTFTSRSYTPGAVPNVPDASLGQIAGMFTSAVPGGLLNSVPDAVDAVSGGNVNSVGTGGAVGRMIDSMTGEKPGEQNGWASDRDHGIANGIGGPQGDGVWTSSPLRALRLVTGTAAPAPNPVRTKTYSSLAV